MIDSRRINDTALVNAIIEMMSRKTPENFAAQVRALLARPAEVSAAMRTWLSEPDSGLGVSGSSFSCGVPHIHG
jgi:hypothetical protein